MTIVEVFKGLYSSNDHIVAQMLSRATYVTSYKVPEKSFMIHTGFTCKVQTGRVFEFLVDAKDWNSPVKLVYQVRNPEIQLPAIAGLMVGKSSGPYYKLFHLFIIQGISLCSESMNYFKPTPNDVHFKKLPHNVFTVFNKEDGSIITEYPISHHHPHVFFLGREEFLVAPPESAMESEEERQYEAYINEFGEPNDASDSEDYIDDDDDDHHI